MFFLFVQPCKDFPATQSYQLGLLSLIAQLRSKGHVAEYLPIWTDDQHAPDYINPEIDVIGIYTIECMIPEVYKFVEAHKAKHHILLGGPAATIAPEYCSQELYYDSLCIGEGELAILEFAEKYGTDSFKKMKGFWFDSGAIRNEQRPRLTQSELESIVHPLRTEYLPVVENSYNVFGQRVTNIYATRGCPFQCTYCSNSTYNKMEGTIYRKRTPMQVLQELEDSISKSRIRLVSFEDDILTLDKPWFSEVMRLFKQRLHDPFGIRFDMTTRVNCITKEQIKQAAEAGCLTIRFGVEAGSELIRKTMGREGIKTEDMVQLAKDILEYNLFPYYCSIIGVPPETPRLFDQTIAVVDTIYGMAQKVNKKATVILNTYYPLHGTTLGEKCYAEGWVKNKTFGIDAHVDYSLETSYMTHEYVLQQQKLFRERYTGMIPMRKGL
jgi:radical SAM superfamily enzyme YgiQ (UPF0313 family)